MDVELLLVAMGLPGDPIQAVQTAHRLRLIDFWQIAPGQRVLEIGCGQGDTLAALAWTVGPEGFVHGMDIADGSYGAPETLAQARERLMRGPLGGRIRIDFGVDVTNPSVTFDQPFDAVVLSHCLWYFASEQQLQAVLTAVRPWAKRLCLAEWDPRAADPAQLPHLQCVTIQALCESCHPTQSNVRTMFYPSDIQRIASAAGWQTERTGLVNSPDLQDAQWEIAAAQLDYPALIDSAEAMPAKMKALLHAQISALPSGREKAEVRPLSVFCMTALQG